MSTLDSGKTRHCKFVDAWRKRNGADVHPLDQHVVNDIDGELLGHANIVAGVLVVHVWMILDTDGYDGRVGRQELKTLNGAALTTSASSTVVTKAVGRGMTIPIRSL